MKSRKQAGARIELSRSRSDFFAILRLRARPFTCMGFSAHAIAPRRKGPSARGLPWFPMFTTDSAETHNPLEPHLRLFRSVSPVTETILTLENETEKRRVYWNTLAQTVNDDVAVAHFIDADGRPVSRALFDDIARFLGDEFLSAAGASVLEIGCGNGLLLFALEALPGKTLHLTGCDFSRKMLDRMICRRAQTFLSEAHQLPCGDSSFDLVCANSVVQYFPNEDYLRTVIRESIRVLKPGGSICLLDVPLQWYESLIWGGHGLKFEIRRSLVKSMEAIVPGLVRRLRASRQTMTDVINGTAVRVPRFQGLSVNPDLFLDYQRQFRRVSVEMQPFLLKPMFYRKYRFNVILRGKVADA